MPSVLVNETIMYSINPNPKGKHEVIEHHLPWPRTSPQLENYLVRGFTFEKPKQIVITCPECGRVCKSEFGLRRHLVSHKGKQV